MKFEVHDLVRNTTTAQSGIVTGIDGVYLSVESPVGTPQVWSAFLCELVSRPKRVVRSAIEDADRAVHATFSKAYLPIDDGTVEGSKPEEPVEDRIQRAYLNGFYDGFTKAKQAGRLDR